MVSGRNGGKVAPIVGKGDARRELKGYQTLLVLLLAGCLNPRPEELPSALEPAPNGADRAEPTAASASDDGSGARAAEPAAEPAGGSAASPESAPAPEPPAVLGAPEPPDAGVDSGPAGELPDASDSSDAG